MLPQPLRRHWQTDSVGISLSVICMAHCLLLPVLLVFGVGLAEFWPGGRDLTHVVMLFFVVPISGIALAGGWLRHRRDGVLGLGLVSVGLLTFAALYAHDNLSPLADALITTLGGGLLALAHWRNQHCPCPNNSHT